MKNELKIYPVPKGAVLQQDYCVRVRLEESEEWQELSTYRVKVDMHDVRNASMAYFDFQGKVEVEITFPRFYSVYCVDIRPLSLGILPEIEPKRIRFTLDKPANLSVEINKDRFHNLHLFAGAIEPALEKTGENVLVVKGSLERAGFIGDEVNHQLNEMPKGRMLYIEAGIYYIGECIWHLPSDTEIYLEGGAILIGGLVLEHGEEVHISGRGMLYLSDFARFSGVNGIRLSHSKNICIENLMFINPPHYTISLGDCENVTIHNVKTFSCEGWSDGIDMMSCRDIMVEGGFIRTSDDCVAIYGSRWDNRGGSSNITVCNLSVWADAAHPLMTGTHGDYPHDGDIIEDILFDEIDILEHHEFQAGYLGVMAFIPETRIKSAGLYRNIRIEPFEHGKVLDFQVKWNPDYNPAPGRSITDILLENIWIQSGNGEETSVINGYNEEAKVCRVTIRDWYRDGKCAESLEETGIQVGSNTEQIILER